MTVSLTTPWSERTHYRIVSSRSPLDEDGYKIGEPKRLECEACGASVQLTEEPSAGVDELPHSPDCLQRWARSEWWTHRFLEADGDLRAF
ncbi:MAG: hypothetical protein ACOCUA_02330 [archaeon]